MSKTVTMSNIITGRINDGNGWREMSDEERQAALNKIKSFLLTTCRPNSRTAAAIRSLHLGNLPENRGIFERLATDGYTAGQDYPSEIAHIKRLLTAGKV